MSITSAYKVFTHDLRPPLQGGDPVFDGTLPSTLPTIGVDHSTKSCGAGWHACQEAPDALRIAGLWRDDRSSRLFKVATDGRVALRDRKFRAASWVITKEVVDITRFVREAHAYFRDSQEVITTEVMAWHKALSQTIPNKEGVVKGLRDALNARDLGGWQLREFRSQQDTLVSASSWTAKEPRTARETKTAWKPSLTATRLTWDTHFSPITKAARDLWGAGVACEGLTVWFAGYKGWTSCDKNLLTTGIRDAHLNGLGFCTPVAADVLGWSMMEPS